MDWAGTNHGILTNGATFAPGKLGQAFSLDGGNDFVEIPDSPSLSLTNSITVEAWIKLDSVPPPSSCDAGYAIACVYDSFSGSAGVSWSCSVSSEGKLGFGVNGSQGGQPASLYVQTTSAAISAAAWTHVAATFDIASQTCAIYVNAVEVPTTVIERVRTVDMLNDNSTPIRVGVFRSGCAQGFDGYFRGFIDEVRLYDRALSPEEIRFNYLRPDNFVDAISPLGRNGGHVNFPITNLVISLIQPLSTSIFNATNIILDGPIGMLQASNITELCDRTYRFGFPPLIVDGAYHITLLPALRGQDGLPLDLNFNGTTGETNDTFTFTLTLDTVPPRVTQRFPSGGVPLELRSMEIEFNEAIDAATFNPADAVIITPTGQTNAVTSVQSLSSNRFRLMLPPLAATGLHRLRLVPNVQDLAGNALDQDRDGTAGEPTDDVYDACLYVHENFGLVAWWTANGNAFDSMGRNDGTLQGSAGFANGRLGQAFLLDGSGDYVLMPSSNSYGITKALTIEAWARADSATPKGTIISKYSQGNNVSWYMSFPPEFTSSRLRFYVQGPSNGFRYVDTDEAVFISNVWTHIGATFDIPSQELKVYVNGKRVPASLHPNSTVITAIKDTTAPVRVGAVQDGNGNLVGFFSGSVDDIRLFNRALTAGEIRKTFELQSELPFAGTPVILIRFQDETKRCKVPAWQDHAGLIHSL